MPFGASWWEKRDLSHALHVTLVARSNHEVSNIYVESIKIMASVSHIGAAGGVVQLLTNFGDTPPANISMNRLANLQALNLIQNAELAEHANYQSAVLEANHKLMTQQLRAHNQSNELLGDIATIAANSN